MTRSFRLSSLVLAVVVLAIPPALSDSYFVYNQAGIPADTDIFTWCDTPPCDLGGITSCDTPEGGSSLRMTTNEWGGYGVFNLVQNVDLSAFANGEMRFFVKVPAASIGSFNLKVEFQCNPSGTGNVSYTKFLRDPTTFAPNYGWDGTNTWQEISIPIADFFAPGPVDTACLANVYSGFVSTIENLPLFNTFWIDGVRWVTPNTHTGASDVQVSGRQLLVDGKPFVVNGMNYSPISVGENWQAAWRDRPDRYLVDFPLIAASGANSVRIYSPLVSTAMLDAAWAEGLYVIPTYGVDSVQLLCPEGKAFMQDQFTEMVEQWKDHPAILFWLVGNEVNLNLGTASLCTDWYPQLDAMAAAAHAAEGASFHPVGTASGDVGDVCVAACSRDTDLPNVDLWGTQIYRGCTFGSAFAEYAGKPDCDRPLVVTEFGVDALKSMSNCSVTTGTSCYVNTDCPMGTCSSDSAPCNLDTDCLQFPTAQTCTGGEFCDGVGMSDEAMQASCLATLLSGADAELAIRKAGGVSSGQVVFEWADEWWKAACLPTGGWEFHDTCANSKNLAYTNDPAINEEWFGIVANETFCSGGSMAACTIDDDCTVGTCSQINDQTARVNKTAHTNVGNSWLGPVCDMAVDSHVDGGDTTISFDPTAGNAVDHTLYYGDLSDVSNYTGTSYTFLGSRSLGATSPSTITSSLPAGNLFWVVAAENGDSLEGCYGTDSAGAERPCSGAGCDANQVAGWNCLCSSQ